jgi:hypothetical protein
VYGAIVMICCRDDKFRSNVFKSHGLEQDSNTESIPILISSVFHEECDSDT